MLRVNYVTDYNYESFTAEVMNGREFEDFHRKLSVGDPAPDGVVMDANTGEEVQLSSLWRSQHVVIEFGSMT